MLNNHTEFIADNDEECPFPEGYGEQGPVKPNYEQKLWLVHRVISGKELAGSLARRYKMKPHCLLTLILRYKKRGYLSNTSGRPTAIDDIGVRTACEFFEEVSDGDTYRLREVIREEYYHTSRRRLNSTIENDSDEERNIKPKKIPRRTMLRYVEKVVHKINT